MYYGSNSHSFVSTNGTGLAAINGTADTAQTSTINGIVFTSAIAGTTVGASETITVNAAANDHATAFGDGEFSSDGDIFNMLQSANWGVSSVTLGGLTIGQEYEVQLFANDARGNRSLNFIMAVGDGSGDAFADNAAGTLELNNSPANGDAPTFPETDAGDSIIGTFTADATSLTFQTWGTNSGNTANFGVGDSRAHVNGIQLRNITAVPEPGSIAILGMGVVGLVARRRRK